MKLVNLICEINKKDGIYYIYQKGYQTKEFSMLHTLINRIEELENAYKKNNKTIYWNFIVK